MHYETTILELLICHVIVYKPVYYMYDSLMLTGQRNLEILICLEHLACVSK